MLTRTAFRTLQTFSRQYHASTVLRKNPHLPQQGYPKDVQQKYNYTIPEPETPARERLTEQAPEKPRRVIVDEFVPTKSHTEKTRYKRPYKLDRTGKPVWAEMKAYDKSRYPGIEVQPIIVPRRERPPWDPQPRETQMTQVEFRNKFSSDEFLEAGVNNDPLLKQMLSFDNASQEEINKREIALAVKRFQKAPGDTASTPVQVAVLTAKINYMTQHMQRNHKDQVTKRALQITINRRKKLMKYLKRKEPEYYWKTIRGLDLRLELN